MEVKIGQVWQYENHRVTVTSRRGDNAWNIDMEPPIIGKGLDWFMDSTFQNCNLLSDPAPTVRPGQVWGWTDTSETCTITSMSDLGGSPAAYIKWEKSGTGLLKLSDFRSATLISDAPSVHSALPDRPGRWRDAYGFLWDAQKPQFGDLEYRYMHDGREGCSFVWGEFGQDYLKNVGPFTHVGDVPAVFPAAVPKLADFDGPPVHTGRPKTIDRGTLAAYEIRATWGWGRIDVDPKLYRVPIKYDQVVGRINPSGPASDREIAARMQAHNDAYAERHKEEIKRAWASMGSYQLPDTGACRWQRKR